MTDERRAEAQLARVKTGFKLRRQQRRQANAVQQSLAANDLQESVVEAVRPFDGWMQVRRWPGEWLPALTRFEAGVGMVVLTATIGDAPMVFGPHPDDGGDFRVRQTPRVTPHSPVYDSPDIGKWQGTSQPVILETGDKAREVIPRNLWLGRQCVWEYDDFTSGALTSGSVGNLGWGFGGNTTVSYVSATTAFPEIHGILRVAVPGTANAIAFVQPGVTPAVLRHPMQVPLRLQFGVIPEPDGVLASHVDRLGISDDPTIAAPANGLYFERLATETQWFGVVRSGGVQRFRQAVGPYQGGILRPLEIEVTFDDTGVNNPVIAFRLPEGGPNGAPTADVTFTPSLPNLADYPVAVGNAFASIQTLNATAKAIHLDWYQGRFFARDRQYDDMRRG